MRKGCAQKVSELFRGGGFEEAECFWGLIPVDGNV